MESYLIHANYCRPYKVTVDRETNTVKVYELEDDTCLHIISTHGIDDYTKDNDYTTEICSFNPVKIFIGESSKESGQHSENEDYKLAGNSILLQMAPHCYVYIGRGKIYKFTTRDEIIEYYSPVFNNDCPEHKKYIKPFGFIYFLCNVIRKI
jgi:hypothetical protein